MCAGGNEDGKVRWCNYGVWGVFKGTRTRDWGFLAACSLPDRRVARRLFMFVCGFGESERHHLSSMLNTEKIADNGNKNNSKQLERPVSNRALSTALQSV